MTREQVDIILYGGKFPESTGRRELVETHISWVILCDKFVYKIKKPVQYSFLDFSTPERRKHFCEREIELNKRLSDNIYLDVQPIREQHGSLEMGGSKGTIIDYAVRMYRQDSERQMDRLLLRNEVTTSDINKLAKKIARFHQSALVIHDKDFLDIREKFNDLEAEKKFLVENLGSPAGDIIRHSIETSDSFMRINAALLHDRLDAGFFRDCHGDLHSRNIFLLPEPQPFDCIEFNDDFRQIDVLNEVAFLCMDLDAFDRKDLSDLFIQYYNRLFPAMRSDGERDLFIYYKAYRANVRAKVNSLRAGSAATREERLKALSAAEKYLALMDNYIGAIAV